MKISEELSNLIIGVLMCRTTESEPILYDTRGILRKIKDWVVGLWRYEL